MALSQPRPIFSIHSLAAYNRVTKLPYGKQIEVLAGSNLASSQELIDLQGGSSFDNWATERGIRTMELSVTFREYPDWLFRLLLGKNPTVNAAEASGNVGTVANYNGTSTVDATTGIASVTAISGSETDLKLGTYIIKVASATTVDIYALSDLDFATGTDGVFVDDTMKITSSAETIATGADTNITGFGFKLTGGSGAIGMTIGDTAIVEVRPINTGSSEVTIGSRSEVFCNFGLYMTGQRMGDGRMVTIDAFNATGGGLPINMTEKAWSEGEVTFKLAYDAVQDGLFKYQYVEGSSAC